MYVGQWLPVPDGFTREECLFFISSEQEGGGDCHTLRYTDRGYIFDLCHSEVADYLVFASKNKKLISNNT